MIARASVLTVVVVAVGCGGAAPRTNEIPAGPLTDDNACTRLCDRLRACGGVPSKCESSCERDRSWLRAGFTAAFVGCVEREVGVNVCTPPDEEKRSGAVALCYSATLNVFAARDGGTSARSVVAAICRQVVRCDPSTTVDEQECIAALEKKLSAASMLLAVAQPQVVASVASCIESSSCDDEHAVKRCIRAVHPNGPQVTP